MKRGFERNKDQKKTKRIRAEGRTREIPKKEGMKAKTRKGMMKMGEKDREEEEGK